MAILMDLHNHCEFSFDSETPMEDNVKKAVEMGLDYISITDHLDLYYPDEDYRDKINIKAYFEKYKRVKEYYKDHIEFLSGIEVGIQTITKDVNEEIVRNFPFDFVIGSIHEINGEDLVTDDVIDKFYSIDDFYKYYYEEIQKTVEDCNDFDVLGHFDYMDRYVIGISEIPHIDNYKEFINPTLKSLITRNKGIEINTAGIRKGLPYMHPKIEILKWYKDLGGTIITVGSDAHKAADIGKGVAEAYEMLKEIGFTTVSVYKNRKEKKLNL